MRTKTIITIIGALLLCAVINLTAQTNAPVPVAQSAPPVGFWDSAKGMGSAFAAFFKDNTNFFAQKTAMVGVDAAYSSGHDNSINGAVDKKTVGGILTVGFPLDQNGQVSIGLWLAYFNSHAYYGSFQTTLGTTFTVPSWVPVLKGQQAFVFNEGGPGWRFENGEMFAQDFVGGVWKHDFQSLFGWKTPWTLYLDGAYGRASIWSSDIYLAGAKIGKTF